MVDNVTLNTGTGGPVMATDDISSVHYQRVKLNAGADGATDGDVTKSNPYPVLPLGLPKTIKVDVTRPADTNVYAAADCISDSTSAPVSGGFTITGAGRASGGSCIITDICVASSNDPATKLSGEIWIFDTSVTNVNDNAAFVVSDTEIKTCCAIIPFSLFDAGNNQYAHITGLNILATCSGSANLRFLLRARNAYTPASAEVLSFAFKLLQID